MLIWGSSFPALKLAFRNLDPMVVIFGRMTIGTFCFLLFIRKLLPVRYQAGDWKLFLIMTISEPCLYFLFEAGALTYTTASQAGMICALLPLMVAVAARFILKETLTARTLFGFALAVGGAVWLSLAAETSESAPNPALGNFLEFVAMATAVGYIISVKKLSLRYSAFFLTAVQMAVGAVFFGGMLFWPTTQLPQSFESTSLGAVIYLGTVVTLGGYMLYNYGVSQIPASQASAFVNLIPVFSAALGWLVLGETFNFSQYLASGLVLVGVFVSQDNAFGRRKKAVPEAA
jgi:drug/metabolite transporter (DMT)-like permease